MKTKYKNVYLDNTPVRNAGADDLILSGSINKAGELTSITSVRTGGINGKNLVFASDGDSTDIPKVWGYYGHDKTAIDMEVCAEYCKYIIENIANRGTSEKSIILLSNKGLSLTTSNGATGDWFDTFGSDRFLNLSTPNALSSSVVTRASFLSADCTNVLKYLDILLNMQNELVEYQTQQTVPIMDHFSIIGVSISAVNSVIEIVGGIPETYCLGPDENTIFTYTATETDGKYTYTISSQSKDPMLTVLKISEDDLLLLLNYVGATPEMHLTPLISTDLLLSGIDYESSEGGGGGGDDQRVN